MKTTIFDTITTNVLNELNYQLAAHDILALMDELGFSSEVPVDDMSIRNRIVDIIKKRDL